MKNILVVGDWVVDEHWIVGRHRSTTASRRGDEHYHALHDLDSGVEALCGAGLVASLLSAAELDRNRAFTVHGIGAWHPADERELATMLLHSGLDKRNPYRVNRERSSQKAVVRLHNVCDEADKPGTTRVIRVYLEPEMKHLYRLDWEQTPPADPASHRLNWIQNASQATKWWKRRQALNGFRPDAIVVKDLVKGVISDALIERLVKSFPAGKTGPRWYISSKQWHLKQERRDSWAVAPDSWLRRLRDQDVRLVFVPQVAAAAAQSTKDINAWTIASGGPSWHAMRIMDALGGAFSRDFKGPEVAILPERSKVFLRTGAGKERALVVGDDPTQGSENRVPVSSVLFASLVAMMEGIGTTQEASAVLATATAKTEDWVKTETGRFQPATWHPSRHTAIDIRQTEGIRYTPRSWGDELDNWVEARRGLGIISSRRKGAHSDRGEITLELWRATTDVEDYVCLVPEKREAVRSIKRELRTFVANPHRNVSVLLESDPGSGKTFLLNKLADELGLELMPFNITRMTSLENILDCFDEIVSRQASAPSRRILVFFDEINAAINKSPVYGTFLDPIDRGTYTRSGRSFHIRPCAWVFAGTGIGDSAPETKGSDFKSRLTLPPLRFPAGDFTEAGDLERVYIGSTFLTRAFPDVTHVSGLVLDAFRLVHPGTSLRDQERLVLKFRDIHKNEVWGNSVPLDAIEETWAEARKKLSRGRGAQARAKSLNSRYRDYKKRLEGWKKRLEARQDGDKVRIVSKPKTSW